jgi:hypothetical protein
LLNYLITRMCEILKHTGRKSKHFCTKCVVK